MPKLLEPKALLSFVKASMPKGCKIVNANAFYWSPRTKTLHFVEERLSDTTGQAALVHEACHALLGHTKYSTDAELLMLEVDAWGKAKELATGIGLDIDPEHIEDCLDTYREWLYARSTCPTCRTTSLQTDKTMYQCISCGASWRVSPSRFCRVYRMRSRNSKTPPQSPRAVFA
jgi:hypothetical protein